MGNRGLVEGLDRQMGLAFYALTVVPIQSFRREVCFAAGSIGTNAHDYLYDSSSLPQEGES
jgi:hypothetical protein